MDDELIAKDVPPPLLVCVEVNPGPQMDTKKRERMIGYLEAGKSNPEAAEHFEVSLSSVKRLKRKVKKTGSVKNLPGQGRKRKLSPKRRKAIKQKLKRGKSSVQVAR